ncbi:MAG: hypothetical protein AAF449_05615 [Myxococcota bacterium]
MASPTEVYCEWFKDLAPEVARELAVLLMRLFPSGLLEPTLSTPDITDGFIPRVRRLAGRTPWSNVGHAITLAALTDFVFVSKGDPEAWREDRERLEVLDEAREMLGDNMHDDIAEFVAQNRLRYPLRAKLWGRAAETWQVLRAGPLSDLEIRSALAQNPVP